MLESKFRETNNLKEDKLNIQIIGRKAKLRRNDLRINSGRQIMTERPWIARIVRSEP